MCAVLSQLGRHDHAMTHAHQAIIIVQSTLLMHHLPMPAHLAKANKDKGYAGHAEEKLRDGINETKEFKDRIAVLTIAYHNLAVEQEFMHMYQEAVSSYKQARDFAIKYLGEKDSISVNLSSTFEKAKIEIENKILKVKN